MDAALRKQWMMTEQDQRISETIDREKPRLRNFIRRRVADPSDAEDILQEVFYELVEAYRLTQPIEQVGAWLFRVARNRITDLFRKKKPEASTNDPHRRGGWRVSIAGGLASFAGCRTGGGLCPNGVAGGA